MYFFSMYKINNAIFLGCNTANVNSAFWLFVVKFYPNLLLLVYYLYIYNIRVRATDVTNFFRIHFLTLQLS